jgi:hypothetical protein
MVAFLGFGYANSSYGVVFIVFSFGGCKNGYLYKSGARFPQNPVTR